MRKLSPLRHGCKANESGWTSIKDEKRRNLADILDRKNYDYSSLRNIDKKELAEISDQIRASESETMTWITEHAEWMAGHAKYLYNLKQYRSYAKIAFAWAAGVLVTLIIVSILNSFANSIGVITYVDYGETITVRTGSGPYVDEQEIDGASTAIGSAIIFLSIMIGARIGMAINAGKLNGGISPQGNIDFIAWFVGIGAYGIGGAIIFALFDADSTFSNIIGNILQLVWAGVIFWIAHGWRNNRLAMLNAKLN